MRASRPGCGRKSPAVTPSGVANISPCSPAEGFGGSFGPLHGSAGWGDAVVSVPWDLYEAYGDVSLLREMWAPMTAWVRFAAAALAATAGPLLHDRGQKRLNIDRNWP